MTHEIGRGLDEAGIVCHLLSVCSASSAALSAMSSSGGCLHLGRLDLAHRPVVEGEAVLATLRSVGGRCGGILTQHTRQAIPQVWLS